MGGALGERDQPRPKPRKAHCCCPHTHTQLSPGQGLQYTLVAPSGSSSGAMYCEPSRQNAAPKQRQKAQRYVARVLASVQGSPPFPPGAATVDPNGSCEAKEPSARCCAWHHNSTQVCDTLSPLGSSPAPPLPCQGGPPRWGERSDVVVREREPPNEPR